VRNLQKYFKKTASGDFSDNLSEIFKKKYLVFQQLLAKNNSVLKIMADMEEKVSGEYLFDAEYIHSSVRKIASGVLHIIENLNALSSEDTYTALCRKFDVLNRDIENMLLWKFEVPISDLTIPLEDISRDMGNIAGGKIAHLGAVKTILNLPTPEGFAVSTYAFKRFMEHNRFLQKTNRLISALSLENLEELYAVSREIQDMIIKSAIPDEVANAIRGAYSDLCRKTGKETTVAVRSSAIHEDGHFSFAGQYATFLNVHGGRIMEKYKEVVASLFTPRAIFYYKTNGFSEEEMAMAVGVLSMVDAKAGGVVYTKDPNDRASDHILINALYGFGKFMEDETVSSDAYSVSRHPEGLIMSRRISHQATMLAIGKDGVLQEVRVPGALQGKQCLTDGQMKTLATYALEIEKYYGCPQDIEWALDSDDHLYILQARRLRIWDIRQKAGLYVPRRIAGYPLLLEKGVIACKGIGVGKAFVLKDEEHLKHFPEGAVLIARRTDPKYVTVMHKASAIITDAGSAMGHMASLTREYRVPAILNSEVATNVIRHGREITVDAIHCNVYEGRVTELIEFTAGKKEPLEEIALFKRLKRILKKIVPLNLVDPEGPHFKPEYCETFHDITRFAREKAIQEMSSIGEGHDMKGLRGAVKLVAGIPVSIRLFDIDGGISPQVKKPSPADILSIPFSAIFKGMSSMTWPEPRPPEERGFSGIHPQFSSSPVKQPFHTEEKSFSIVARNYMKFSIRLGYHFSTIEAYAAETMNDNYIKFFFKGGGSSLERRLRRVRLIQEILRKLEFTIRVEGDVVNAVLAKYKQSTIEETLYILGKLTAYTKQLDAVLYNDAVTDMYIDQFVNEHIRKPSTVKSEH
jgi:pyruvate,water dikinase